MEPQLPSPSQAPENGQAHFRGGETFPAVNQPERQPEQAERQETREQHTGGPTEPAATVQPVPALPPLPTAQPTQQTSAPVTDDTNPAMAADEDLIEKEWV